MNKKRILKRFQPYLWSTKAENLDPEKHKAYIVHHVLMYGELEDIKQLFKLYPKEEIRQVFLKKPLKVYTRPAFHFVKNYILKLSNAKIPEEKYVGTFHRKTKSSLK